MFQMFYLTDEIKSFICRHRAYAFTVGNDGVPNVSCNKKVVVMDDGHLALTGVRSGKDLKNLHGNPFISLTIVGTEPCAGYQIKGRAQILEDGRKVGERASLCGRTPCAILVTVEEIRTLGNCCPAVKTRAEPDGAVV
jgi:predicted pyridoxine 5'-phosphate oxidase superfamily flavin-nucleotide-binding protein